MDVTCTFLEKFTKQEKALVTKVKIEVKEKGKALPYDPMESGIPDGRVRPVYPFCIAVLSLAAAFVIY